MALPLVHKLRYLCRIAHLWEIAWVEVLVEVIDKLEALEEENRKLRLLLNHLQYGTCCQQCEVLCDDGGDDAKK